MGDHNDLEYVRDVLDQVLTGEVSPDAVMAALEIVTGMIGEQDGDTEATDSQASDGQDDAPAAESVPSDTADS